MKVLTISTKQLQILSQQLLDKVQKEDFNPDMLIGVATGGVHVSRPMQQILEEKAWRGEYYEIKLQRASTRIKKKYALKSLFEILPYALLNLLRLLESKVSEMLKSDTYTPSKEKEIHFSYFCIRALSRAKTLLLVDDAIDTGATLLAIKEAIYRINPEIEIKIAVFTVTHNHPYIYPEYSLFDRVLLRCPWAEDYKGSDKIG